MKKTDVKVLKKLAIVLCVIVSLVILIPNIPMNAASGDVIITSFTIAPSSSGGEKTDTVAYEVSRRASDVVTVRGTYQIANPAGVTDALVSIKLSNKDVGNLFGGSHAYFTALNKDVAWPIGSSNQSITVDGNDVTVSFTVSGTLGSSGSFTIGFLFDNSLTGHVGYIPDGKLLAEVTTGGAVTEANLRTVTAKVDDNHNLIFEKSVPTNLELDQTMRLGLTGSIYTDKSVDNYKWRLEPGTYIKLILEYPADAVVNIPSSGEGTIPSSAIDRSVPGKIVWTVGPVDANGGIPAAQSVALHNVGRKIGYALGSGLSITFPSGDFSVGDNITLNAYLEYSLVNKTVKSQKVKTFEFDIVEAGIHMVPVYSLALSSSAKITIDGSGGDHPSVGITDGGINKALRNGSSLPVPNARTTWFNDANSAGRPANLTELTLNYYSAGITSVLFKIELVYYIVGAGGPREVRYLVTPNNTRFVVSNATAGVVLAAGEYIDKIDICPLYNNLSETNEQTAANMKYGLPVQGLVYMDYKYATWADGKFPNGTAIQHGDITETAIEYYWEGESRPDEHTGAYVSSKTPDTDGLGGTTIRLRSISNDLNAQQRIYWMAPNTIDPRIEISLQAGEAASKTPGSNINIYAELYNPSPFANTNMVNPTLWYIPPSHIELDVTQPLNLTNGNGGATTATATVVETTLNVNGVDMRAYKFSITGTLKESGGITDLANIKMALSLRIKAGTAAGSQHITAYQFNNNYVRGLMFLTQDAPHVMVFNGRPVTGFVTDTHDLDNNPQTTSIFSPQFSFNVSATSSMKVLADMYNNIDNEWQNVSMLNAKATVNTSAAGRGDFKLTIENEGNSYIGDIQLLDILPHVSTHEKTALNPTEAKESEWTANLKQALDVKIYDVDGVDKTADFTGAYTVEYSTFGDPTYDGGVSGIQRTGISGDFTNNGTYENAKSFLFKWTSTTKRLPPGYSVVITGTIKAPADVVDADDGKVAYNSFAVQSLYYNTATGGTGTPATLAAPVKQKFILLDMAEIAVKYYINGTYRSDLDGEVLGKFMGDTVTFDEVDLYPGSTIYTVGAGTTTFPYTVVSAGSDEISVYYNSPAATVGLKYYVNGVHISALDDTLSGYIGDTITLSDVDIYPGSSSYSVTTGTTTFPYTIATASSDVISVYYLQETMSVIYDLNGGTAGSGPATQTDLPATTGHTLLTTPIPTHPDAADDTAIVFIGWTAAADSKIYAKGEMTSLPTRLTQIPLVDEDVTVYALWGYDTNGNGTADVLEDLFDVIYDLNGGTASSGPATQTDLLPTTDHALLTTPIPTHEDAADDTAIVFIGWTAAADSKTYAKGEKTSLPARITEVDIVDDDVTVYALWGYDTNGNGIADVLEDVFDVIYSVNDGTAGSGPATQTDLLPTTNHTLLTTPIPTHEDAADDTAIVFIGWTAAADSKIYAKGERTSLPTRITQVSITTADVTVHALWGYDTNSNGIADVLEDFFDITYDVNGGTAGSGPATQSKIAGPYTLSTTPIPTHADAADDTAIVFIGWTAAADSTIYAKGEQASLPARITDVTIAATNVTVHALWGYDTNDNGTADVLEDFFDITYDVNGGIAGSGPATQSKIVGPYTLLTTPVPTHADAADDTAIVFIGWTEAADSTIYAKGENTLLPAIITDVSIVDDDVTVYALWGYDTNGNGKADVLEDLFDVIYDLNGGTASSGPATHSEIPGTYTLLTTPTPTHDADNGIDVVFIGWTDATDSTIYAKDDTLPSNIVTQAVIDDANVTVYALWGYDENGNGIADILEDKFSLIYNDNGGSGGPGTVVGLIAKTHTLNSAGKPTHSKANNKAMLFIGWTETLDAKIYAKGENALLPTRITQIDIVDEDVTVYALWGYDENKNGTADVFENLFSVTYDLNDGANNVPVKETNLLPVNGHTLLTTPIPTHKNAADGTPIIFIGWTEAADGNIYEIGEIGSLPALITQVNIVDADVIVYALWGYDTNGNGKADVLETTYTVEYYYGKVRDDSATYYGIGEIGDILSGIEPKNRKGYVLDKIKGLDRALDADPTVNVIKVYYIRIPAQVPSTGDSNVLHSAIMLLFTTSVCVSGITMIRNKKRKSASTNL